MVTRTSRQQFKADPQFRRLSWYAAIFGQTTTIKEMQAGKLVTYPERIVPGAFTESLAGNVEVIANIDHDDGKAFARRSDGSLVLQEDPHGLFCSAWVPEGEFGDKILAAVEAGTLDGCSFRFEPVNSRTAEDGTVERVSVVLADVCLTAYPAYKDTHILARTARTKFLLTKLRLLKTRTA